MAEFSYDEISRFVRYDPDTGRIFWRQRTPEMFKVTNRHAEACCRSWNAKHSGKEAFITGSSDGYRRGEINGVEHKAHRIIWLLHYGSYPAGQIDHINGVPSDNRISNLRVVTNAENGKNRKLYVNNSSGIQGVYWDRREGKWRAQIKVDGRWERLGYFSDLDEAASARNAAERKYGFHENHGRRPLPLYVANTQSRALVPGHDDARPSASSNAPAVHLRSAGAYELMGEPDHG